MALALIYTEVQVSMFAGLGLILCVVPVMLVAIYILTYNRNFKVIEGDVRVKLTGEVLAGIRILKYFSWERAFEKKIDQVREREMTYLTRQTASVPIFIMMIMLIPICMPVVIFFCYISLGNQLDPSKAFTVISLFALIMTPVYLIPQLIQFVVLAMNSVERISKFLESDELPKYVQAEGGPLVDDVVICMQNASLSWLSEDDVRAAAEVEAAAKKETEEREEKERKKRGGGGAALYKPVPTSVESADVGLELAAPSVEHKDQNNDDDEVAAAAGTNRAVATLMDLNVTIKRGQIVAVIGAVGSGKSSFLAGLLGELQPARFTADPGSVNMRGTVAYHSQVPWILNATVRENILFGQSYDAERFQMVMEASCLGPDIDMLPAGLETQIGERGINLSGPLSGYNILLRKISSSHSFSLFFSFSKADKRRA